MKITWREFFKFVLLCLAIAAFIYLMHILFPRIKTTADTILFMPIIIKSAVVTCSVICVVAVLSLFVMVCAAVFTPIKPSKITNEVEQKATLSDVIVTGELKKELEIICNSVSEETQKKFKILGYEPPRGYLFYGPPGNGKTLLARAIAGEANISFESISASELVGAYAGQGVYHVRNFFERAKKKAPCIIFIDEIDSIGAKRDSVGHPVSENCNKTLNQLLNEMDGFNLNQGVIVIAATNRLDVLDPALLRPGRFDKKIKIPLPDVNLREKILNLYMKDVPTASELNLTEIAGGTDGFSGADLRYLVNEVKRHVVEWTEETDTAELIITMDDFTKALEKPKNEFQKHENEEANVENVLQTFLSIGQRNPNRLAGA